MLSIPYTGENGFGSLSFQPSDMYSSSCRPGLFLWVVVIWTSYIPVSVVTTMSDEQRLLKKLKKNYDPAVRPVYNASDKVVIGLGITLTQILDVDERNQVLTLNVWLDQEWTDEKLHWDPLLYGNLTTIRVPCKLIWKPDIVLYNSVESHEGYMQSLSMVQYDGHVFWPPIVRMRSSCKMDITYFPFDDQICLLKLGSWAYDGFQVDVMNRTTDIDLSNYVDNGEWILIDTKAVRKVVHYPCCPEPFPDVTFYIHMRRRTLYYMFNVIVPCILLSTLSLAGFYLPPDCGEKITLGLTVLLALSVFMLLVADNIPATSEFAPLIGIYLTIVMAISAISVVLSVFVLSLHYRGNRFKRPPLWLRRIMFQWIAKILRVRIHDHNNHDWYEKTLTHQLSDDSLNSFMTEITKCDLHCNGLKHPLTKEEIRHTVGGQGHRQLAPVHMTEEEVLKYFQLVLAGHDKTMMERSLIEEWQDIAVIVDRIFFCFFLTVTILSTIILLVIQPMTKHINIEQTIQS